MKVLHISTLSSGGAFNSAFRLHQGLLGVSVDSCFLTLQPNEFSQGYSFPAKGNYGYALKKRILNKIGANRFRSKEREKDRFRVKYEIESFTSPFSDFALGAYVNDHFKPDLINLHWVANFIDYSEFFTQINVPVVWTLHDQQPFAGYWHYSNDRPFGEVEKSVDQKYLEYKQNALKSFKTPLHIVAPSSWLLEESQRSDLFASYPHHLIRYGLDTSVFRPTSEKPKSIEHRDTRKIKLLFICQSLANKRKGMQILFDALKELDSSKYQLIAVGEHNESIVNILDVEVLFTGPISDDHELARLYSHADAMIIPSLQDNLPNTMLESLACGTPVIGTPVGGIKEILDSQSLGILSNCIDPVSLTKAIKQFDASKFQPDKIRKKCLEQFELQIQGNKYTELYRSVLGIEKEE